MKKILSITAFAIFAIALAFCTYYLMNKDCSACNGTTCLDSGSVQYVGQGFSGYCHYKVEVSGRNFCIAPYVYYDDLTDVNEPLHWALMGYYDQKDLCIIYRGDIYLTSGHNYHIWFECPGGSFDWGETGPQSCW